MRRILVPILAGLAACGGSTAAAPAPERPAQAGEAASLEPFPLPAAAVAYARFATAISLTDVLAMLSPVKMRDSQRDAMVSEVRGYLEREIGIDVTRARRLDAILLSPVPQPQVVIAIQPVGGALQTAAAATHREHALHAIDDDVVGVMRGEVLLLGHAAAVSAALDTLDGVAQAMSEDTTLAGLVSEHPRANLLFVADFDAVPMLAAQMGPLRVSAAVAAIDPRGAVVSLLGERAALDRIAALVRDGTAELKQELLEEKQRATGGGNVGAGVATIAGYHVASTVAEAIVPVIEGDRLTMRAPLAFAEVAAAVPVIGVLAAVAVPAFQQYIEKSSSAYGANEAPAETIEKP